jgi:hypothetical protein
MNRKEVKKKTKMMEQQDFNVTAPEVVTSTNGNYTTNIEIIESVQIQDSQDLFGFGNGDPLFAYKLFASILVVVASFILSWLFTLISKKIFRDCCCGWELRSDEEMIKSRLIHVHVLKLARQQIMNEQRNLGFPQASSTMKGGGGPLSINPSLASQTQPFPSPNYFGASGTGMGSRTGLNANPSRYSAQYNSSYAKDNGEYGNNLNLEEGGYPRTKNPEESNYGNKTNKKPSILHGNNALTVKNTFNEYYHGFKGYIRSNLFLQIRTIVCTCIIFVGFMLAMALIGQNFIALIMSFGVFGVISLIQLGMYVGNFFSHLWTIFTGKVKIDDYIQLNGVEGIVQDLGWINAVLYSINPEYDFSVLVELEKKSLLVIQSQNDINNNVVNHGVSSSDKKTKKDFDHSRRSAVNNMDNSMGDVCITMGSLGDHTLNHASGYDGKNVLGMSYAMPYGSGNGYDTNNIYCSNSVYENGWNNTVHRLPKNSHLAYDVPILVIHIPNNDLVFGRVIKIPI